MKTQNLEKQRNYFKSLNIKAKLPAFFEGKKWITEDGQVYSVVDSKYNILEVPKLAKLRISRTGRVSTNAKVQSKSRDYSLSRLVAACFLGLDISDRKLVVKHKDGNPLNNAADNLYITDRQQAFLNATKEKRQKIQQVKSFLMDSACKTLEFEKNL